MCCNFCGLRSTLAARLAPLDRCPDHREAGDYRRPAPGGISALLEVAIAGAWRQAEDYQRPPQESDVYFDNLKTQDGNLGRKGARD